MFRQQQIKNLQDQKLKQNNKKLKEKNKSKPTALTAPFPFRELKGNPRIRTNASASSSSSSSSSFSIPVEAPKGCLRPVLASNSNSSACDKVNCDRPIAAKSLKENHFHRTLQKDKRSFICRQESANTKKPTSKPVIRSKLYSDSSISLRKCSYGARGFRLRSKNLKQVDEKIGSGIPIVLPERLKPARDLNCSGKNISPSNVDHEVVELDSISASNSVKTPPVEASVSPEIQFGAAPKGLVASSGTPVCYGAGHLLSGVKDKRKCRPRGILIIGKELDPLGSKETDILENGSDENTGEIFPKLRPSFVPLPVEASMKWLLSPDGDVVEVQKSSVGASSSSLKSCCQGVSGFGSDRDHRENCLDVDDGKSIAKTRIVLLSPKEFPSFRGFSGGSDVNVDGDLSSPSGTLGSKDADCFEILENFRFSSTAEKSSFSICSVSCGNVVRTPTSDLSSKAAGFCWIDTDSHERKTFGLELDSTADIPGKASISPRIQRPLLNDQDYPSLDQQQHHDEHDECASWVESTLASMSLSGMKISWREGLGSQTFYTDDLDCTRCLSNEENDCGHTNLPIAPEPGLIEKQKPSRNSGGLSSVQLFNLEGSNHAKKGKEKMCQAETDVSAESICIDAGSLVASGDSDWTLSYKNHLFRV